MKQEAHKSARTNDEITYSLKQHEWNSGLKKERDKDNVTLRVTRLVGWGMFKIQSYDK